MKNSPLINVLLGLTAICTVGSVVLCFGVVRNTRELRALQGQAAFVNYRQNLVNSLVNDVAEYSKANPAVLPILESVGVKPAAKPGTAPVPAPAPAKSNR